MVFERVSEKIIYKENLVAEIVIIGGGDGAGLAAAVAAIEKSCINPH